MVVLLESEQTGSTFCRGIVFTVFTFSWDAARYFRTMHLSLRPITSMASIRCAPESWDKLTAYYYETYTQQINSSC
jgi:hypothetical protein